MHVPPMKLLATNVYGTFLGNPNIDNAIRATGPPSINDYSNILSVLGTSTNIVSSKYSNQDVNMDGTIRATGPPTINDYSKLLNILGGSTKVISKPSF